MSILGDKALPIVRVRLNRMSTDESLDPLLVPMLEAAEAEIARESGPLVDDDPADLMLLVDCVVWRYQSRDKPGGMPEWLRYARRQRFTRIRGGGGT